MDTDASFEGPIEIGTASNVAAPGDIATLHARFVRYPGCQQLQLWLPRSGLLHEGRLRMQHANGTLLADGRLSDYLNGAVQMLFDTLPWPPGEVRIEVDCDDGVGHRLVLNKLDREPEPVAPPALPPPAAAPSAPRVYRDGFGRVIEDVDLKLREGVNGWLKRWFGRRLDYSGTFRAGTIHYIEPGLAIDFFHEMCGGDLHFSIDVPTVEEWERATKSPLERRDEILSFVAERVRCEKASSWKYRITPRSIDFY